MSFDISSIIWIVMAVVFLQPLLMGRVYAMQRMQAIRGIERAHASRVITMIHRQEQRRLGVLGLFDADDGSNREEGRRDQ